MLHVIFTIIAATALALIEYVVFFLPNNYFFEGDTIHWFYLRHRSVQDFLLSFFTLDPAGWYRPLTNRTVQSLFYPLFGFEPPGYRVVHFVLVTSALLAVYKLSSLVTKRRLAASIAAFFFAVHSVNAFTSFDVLFTPEVVYTFFYICAVIAYLRHRETNSRRMLAASVLLFVAGLCSKEAAVTLPVMLIALDVVLNRAPLLKAAAGARAHLLVLAVYVALVFGYLEVQRPAFQSIFARPGPEVAYRFSLDRTILDNAGLAVTWAFNMPRGWQTDGRNLRGWMMTYLKGFRVLVLLLGAGVLLLPERRLMAAGFAWFFIAVAPGLPLFEHFLPQYLFLPLAGFSIAIGTIFDAAWRKAATVGTLYERPAGAATAAVFVVLAGICAFGARNDMRNNRVLGWSSRVALNSMNDLKAAHPALQPHTTIYFSDADEPDLAWDTAQGELFKMAYGDDTIHTLYWGWGEVITQGVMERGPVIVMKFRDFHAADVTKDFLAASEPPVSYRAPEGYRLEISPAAAASGQKYRLSISGLPNTGVTVHYTLNGGPVQAFQALLDNNHQVTFDVSDRTEKGLYKFVGFRMPAGDWLQAAASIQIN